MKLVKIYNKNDKRTPSFAVVVNESKDFYTIESFDSYLSKIDKKGNVTGSCLSWVEATEEEFNDFRESIISLPFISEDLYFFDDLKTCSNTISSSLCEDGRDIHSILEKYLEKELKNRNIGDKAIIIYKNNTYSLMERKNKYKIDFSFVAASQEFFNVLKIGI